MTAKVAAAARPVQHTGQRDASGCHLAKKRRANGKVGSERSKPVANIRIILHGKAAGNAGVRAAVGKLRKDGHFAEVRVTWEPGDAARLTAEAIADAAGGKIDCIVAGGGDGTINEVFGAAYTAGLPAGCCLGVLPLGTANDFAHATGIPLHDPAAALQLAAGAAPRWIDLGLLNGRPFVNLVSGGFGSRVTVETDPELKRLLGGLAYVLTGISRFSELSANRGSFRAEGFSWEGSFMAVAIGNGRQAGGGVPLCPDALIDDGQLDLMILPELDRAARREAFSHLLREGAAGIRAQQITTRSSWIEWQSDDDLNVNLDGEPVLVKRFRIECRRRVLPVRLGESPLVSSDQQAGWPKA
jgi:lipid kinase YegS